MDAGIPVDACIPPAVLQDGGQGPILSEAGGQKMTDSVKRPVWVTTIYSNTRCNL